jgi:DNA-binding transcriptional LysR family regulator
LDRFQEMTVFAAVVEAGSFVGAAEALGISKAVASRLVAELEARLGVRLLHRTTRKLSLTEEGRTFHARCKSVLADVDEAEAEITAQSGQARGLLKVNVPVTFGVMHLAPLWGDFMAQNPEVSLDVTLSDRFVDLVEEGYDLAVRIGRLGNSSLISRQLSSTRMVLCASPGYLAVHGHPSHPEDLARHAVMGYSLFSTGDVWEFTGPKGPVSVKVRPRLRTNNGDTCVQAALHHQGVILQPTFMVQPHLRDGTLREILPQFRSTELGIQAVYPSRQHVAPRISVLIDYLQRALRGRDWS